MVPEWFDPNTQALSSLLWTPKTHAFLAEQDERVPSVFSKPETGVELEAQGGCCSMEQNNSTALPLKLPQGSA